MSKPQKSKRWRHKAKVKKSLEYIDKMNRKNKDFGKKKLSKLYGIKL